MIQPSKQRHVERLSVPRRFRAPGRNGRAVNLLDLSPAGARIEHGEPLRDWSRYPMALPLALGGGRVWGKVVWSRVLGPQEGGEGKPWLAYQSGLAFPHCTREEQAALTAALVRIAGEWVLGLLRDLREQGAADPAPQERFDALCSETLAWLRQEIGALRFDTIPATSSAGPARRIRRTQIHGPAGESLWVHLYVQPVGATWAAMIVAEGEVPPEPGTMKGIVFFAETAEGAERLALRHLGEGEAQN
jgi:hypothetical protein